MLPTPRMTGFVENWYTIGANMRIQPFYKRLRNHEIQGQHLMKSEMLTLNYNLYVLYKKGHYLTNKLLLSQTISSAGAVRGALRSAAGGRREVIGGAN
jgi:hypothetical protein